MTLEPSAQLALGATLLVGLPLMLVAAGVLAHVYLLATQPAHRDASNLDALVEGMVTSTVDRLLAELRAQAGAPAPAAPAAVEGAPAPLAPLASLAPSHAGISAVEAAGPGLASAPEASPLHSASGLRRAVSRLVAEGLSDRSIARRLGVGIEEVRIARPGGTAR